MTSHAIDVNRISCAYDTAPVVADVSLHIPPGQFVGMIGPSGAGKTTLLRAMLGLVPRVAGTVTVNGRQVLPGRPPLCVGYVPQVETVDWGFPVTVDNVVAMGKSGGFGRSPWLMRNERAEIENILDRLGIGGFGGRHIRDLSGGQQQRTFLARALIGQPRILFLDEPTASVDIKTRDDILHLLVELNAGGVTIVMTTHELNTVAAHLPWVVCVNGGIVAQGHPMNVFNARTLTRTFNSEMRVVADPQTGSLLVAEAGTHGPFANLNTPPASVSRHLATAAD